jgi:putative DNA primase/helicase
LFGRLANISTELSKDSLKNVAMLKQVTGGDTVRAERKNKDHFEFRVKTRLFFSCNDLPPVGKFDQAFFNRLHIVKCDNKIPEEDQDPKMLEKITTPQAKSAWLNKALDGARRLMENERFTVPNDVKRNIAEYRMASDSVSEFIEKEMKEEKDASETKQDVYNAYKSWCSQSGRSPCSKAKFTRRAKKEPHELTLWNPVVNGEQTESWKDVRLKTKNIDEIKSG